MAPVATSVSVAKAFLTNQRTFLEDHMTGFATFLLSVFCHMKISFPSVKIFETFGIDLASKNTTLDPF